MTIIIVGADDIGLHLIDLAARDGIDLVVVEEDSKQADTVRTEYDCTVINDDPASLKVLKKAGGERADTLIATTSVTRSTLRPACSDKNSVLTLLSPLSTTPNTATCLNSSEYTPSKTHID